MFETILSQVDLTSFIGKLLLLTIVVVGASLLQRVVERMARDALEVANVPQASIFINILRGLIWSFALLMVLQPVFGVEPTGFVTALGVTSFALSFGLQDTISNLFGGLSLMLSRVIVPGDTVTIGDFTGRVVDINWRSTIVEARGGNQEVISNSVLSKSSFTKLTEGAAAASSFTIVVRSDANPAEVERQILERIPAALGDLADPGRTPVVQFGSADAYGITVTVVLFIAPEVMGAAANDRVMRALAGMPWLARVNEM